MKASVRIAALLAALGGAALLQACFPVVAGAFAGGVMMATDRRTVATQTVDQEIEIKALTPLREALGERGHVNVTSYNRQVLLTGEVPTEEDKKRAEEVVGKVINVKSVVNELEVAGNSSLGSRSSDALISGKVKASLVDAKDVFANAYKVVTERGVVYLMGIVTEREANRGAEIASRVSGVQRVVKVFEIISEDELKRMSNDPANNAKPAQPASAAS
jgi:osmotically-inducible protein OsmY